MTGFWIELALLVFIIVMAGSAAWAAWRAAPFVPTWGSDVQRLLDLAGVKTGDTVVDLGSGDGRLVLAAAERGATATGYEISVVPFLVGHLRRLFSPARSRATFKFTDLFQANLESVDVVLMFLVPRSVNALATKLMAELRPGTRVVSYAFKIPNWEPIIKDKPNPKKLAVWVYRVPEH